MVALGGNALLRDGQEGTIDQQEQNTAETLESIIFLVKKGYNIVLSHGNGPQVGNIMMQNEAGEQMYDIPRMPLDVCVADSQGAIGYMIERTLHNVLRKHNLSREVVTLVTMVKVDKDDEAFQNPTKRVGRIYDKQQADRLAKEKGWVFKEEVKTTRGWRRVVASPKPVNVMNDKVVEGLAKTGTIVIASGGGGVPVYIDENNNVRPSEAVIDKDLASSLLAAEIGADEFYILTDVPYVYINYKQPGEKIIEHLKVADAKRYLEQGMFGEGSMAPKIHASLQFVENGGSRSVITEAFKLEDTSFGTSITK